MIRGISAIICVFILLTSFLLLIVMSGVGYSYFHHEILRFLDKNNMDVLFGCGIGVGIILFIVVWLFLAFPKIFIHYVLTFPIFLMMCILYIVYTVPEKNTEDFLVKINRLWIESVYVRKIQLLNRCCGWFNATDRGLTNCPYDYDSGCFNKFRDFIHPRLKEMFISSIVMLLFCSISLVGLLINLCTTDEENFFVLCEDVY